MDKFCYSCGAPLMPEFQGPAENYCKYCTDDSGELKSRDQVKPGIVQWIQSWQPDVSEAQASHRADLYMNAMPAWAE